MATVTVKIPSEAHAKLGGFAAADKRPMGEILSDLIEREQRRRFWEEYDRSIAQLQANPEAWADYQAEIRSLEGTLMDGLEDDPWFE